MDKSLAYIVASNAGIATPKHWVLMADEKIDPDSLPLADVIDRLVTLTLHGKKR